MKKHVNPINFQFNNQPNEKQNIAKISQLLLNVLPIKHHKCHKFHSNCN